MCCNILQLNIGVTSNSIFFFGGGGGGGGGGVWGRNIHCDAAICVACMNINKVSRVKYWGGSLALPTPSSYAHAKDHSPILGHPTVQVLSMQKLGAWEGGERDHTFWAHTLIAVFISCASCYRLLVAA